MAFHPLQKDLVAPPCDLCGYTPLFLTQMEGVSLRQFSFLDVLVGQIVAYESSFIALDAADLLLRPTVVPTAILGHPTMVYCSTNGSHG